MVRSAVRLRPRRPVRRRCIVVRPTCGMGSDFRWMPSFPSQAEEKKHIRRHYLDANEFGVNCADEYVRLAEAFSDGPWPAGVEDRQRVDLRHVRFLESCGWYAALRPDRSVLLTFHVLYPAGTPNAFRPHSCGTNREYVELDIAGQRP
jgi:hypothetical protein